MTVGIAAIINEDKAIILASDKMISAGDVTFDIPTILKSFRFHNRWAGLCAGDVTQVPPIMRRVTAALSPKDNLDVTEVVCTFVRVYREERARLAEQVVLSPFGLDMPTFLNLLVSNESAELAEMKRHIQSIDFSPEFLVAGFNPDGKPTFSQ